MTLRRYLVTRGQLSFAEPTLRAVHRSQIVRQLNPTLEEYMCDRLPLFYRSSSDITRDLKAGRFATAFKRTLERLPTKPSFCDSHFGEILAGVFAEDILGLTLIYSKLSYTTTPNENPRKMDLLLCDLGSEPADLVLGEVKCSTKTTFPAAHDTSCYPDLFRSLNAYTEADLAFDLGAASDRIADFEPVTRERIRRALDPYSTSAVRYAGFAVIDLSTDVEAETRMLGTRVCDKTFAADLLAVETFGDVAEAAYARLERMRCSL